MATPGTTLENTITRTGLNKSDAEATVDDRSMASARGLQLSASAVKQS
jgi:hypothetical protein